MLLLQMMEPCSAVHEPENTKAASAWNTQRQAAPRHPQAFLLTATQHHSGLIHVDENSCLVTNGPSRSGPLWVPRWLTTNSNLWRKSTHKSKNCKFRGQFWGPFLDPKMGLRLAALLRILLKPDFEVHFWGLFWDPKLGPKIDRKTHKKSANKSGKSSKTGSRDSEKTICGSQPKLLGTHCESNPTIDHLQRALAASTGCVHVMRHALPMI